METIYIFTVFVALSLLVALLFKVLFVKMEPDPDCVVCKGRGFYSSPVPHEQAGFNEPEVCHCLRPVKKKELPTRKDFDTAEDYELELNKFYEDKTRKH
jgi:hypothetical protein